MSTNQSKNSEKVITFEPQIARIAALPCSTRPATNRGRGNAIRENERRKKNATNKTSESKGDQEKEH